MAFPEGDDYRGQIAHVEGSRIYIDGEDGSSLNVSYPRSFTKEEKKQFKGKMASVNEVRSRGLQSDDYSIILEIETEGSPTTLEYHRISGKAIEMVTVFRQDTFSTD